MTILIRDSRPEDVPAIHAIYSHWVLHGLASWEYEPPPVEDIARRRAAVLAAGYPHMVAEGDGGVVGYTYASAYRPRPGYRFCVENSVYVAPGLHRGGVGRRMLQDLIARCEALGFRQMIAIIGDSGNAASIGLHRACGFADAGLLPAIGWKFGRWVDSVLMIRPLGEADRTPPAGA